MGCRRAWYRSDRAPLQRSTSLFGGKVTREEGFLARSCLLNDDPRVLVGNLETSFNWYDEMGGPRRDHGARLMHGPHPLWPCDTRTRCHTSSDTNHRPQSPTPRLSCWLRTDRPLGLKISRVVPWSGMHRLSMAQHSRMVSMGDLSQTIAHTGMAHFTIQPSDAWTDMVTTMSVYHPIVLAGDGNLISDPMNPWLRIIATLQTRDSDIDIHMRTARCKIVNCVFFERTHGCFATKIANPLLRTRPFMHTGPSLKLYTISALCPRSNQPIHAPLPARGLGCSGSHRSLDAFPLRIVSCAPGSI